MLGIIFCGTIVVLYVMPLTRKPSKINSEIFKAFRKIETYCWDYIKEDNVILNEYERCKKVIECQKQAMLGSQDGSYLAVDYYRDLERLGFKLPPLYQEK